MNFSQVSSKLQPFGECDCESDLEKLGEDGYSKYYLDSVHFSRESLNSSVYLIVGRRGTGKTAIANSFKFHNTLKGSIEIYIDTPDSYQAVITKIIDGSTALGRDLQIPRLVKIWEYIIWSAIFHELRDISPAINAACSMSKETGFSQMLYKILELLAEKHLDQGGDLLEAVNSILQEKNFPRAKQDVLEFSKLNPVVICIDTLGNRPRKPEILGNAELELR